MLASSGEDSFPAATLLICDCFFISLGELCGSFRNIFDYLQVSLLLVAFGTAYFHFPFGDDAVTLSDGLITARAFAFQEI